MPTAGFCEICRRYVWVTPDGCQNGHPAAYVHSLYEAQAADEPAGTPPSGVAPPPSPAVPEPLRPRPAMPHDAERLAPASAGDVIPGAPAPLSGEGAQAVPRSPYAGSADAIALLDDPLGVGPFPHVLDGFNLGAWALGPFWAFARGAWALGLALLGIVVLEFFLIPAPEGDGPIPYPWWIVLVGLVLAYETVSLLLGWRGNRIVWNGKARLVAEGTYLVPKSIRSYLAAERGWRIVGLVWRVPVFLVAAMGVADASADIGFGVASLVVLVFTLVGFVIAGTRRMASI